LNNLKRNKMKQTAVEWLVEQFNSEEFIYRDRTNIIQQAKEMEKQQHSATYGNALKDMISNKIDFEKYYKETFKK